MKTCIHVVLTIAISFICRKFALLSWLVWVCLLSTCQGAEKTIQCGSIKNHFVGRDYKTCYFNKTAAIDSRGFSITSSEDETIEQLYIKSNKNIFYLPENIHEKFPNIESIIASSCSIKSISKEVFKNLTHLKRFDANLNQITEIESYLFEDLISLEHLGLCE